jgi:ABC-type bacteriocin/lantibiotic exporter with double-glycine peptidase domain
VMESIDTLDDQLTVIIVAHRLTSLKNCTQIVELEGGVVKRTGNYANIISQVN